MRVYSEPTSSQIMLKKAEVGIEWALPAVLTAEQSR
jgi:hypothetical protein